MCHVYIASDVAVLPNIDRVVSDGPTKEWQGPVYSFEIYSSMTFVHLFSQPLSSPSGVLSIRNKKIIPQHS
jgi:hypothetical protein